MRGPLEGWRVASTGLGPLPRIKRSALGLGCGSEGRLAVPLPRAAVISTRLRVRSRAPGRQAARLGLGLGLRLGLGLGLGLAYLCALAGAAEPRARLAEGQASRRAPALLVPGELAHRAGEQRPASPLCRVRVRGRGRVRSGLGLGQG